MFVRVAFVALCLAAGARAGSAESESCSNDPSARCSTSSASSAEDDGLELLQLRRLGRANESDAASKFKKQVLLIIDMQNDYSVAYNFATYGTLKNPFLSEDSPPIEDVVKEQLKVINAKSMDWDMIAFSQDWLIPSIFASIGYCPDPPACNNQSFCVRNTPGAEPFQDLLDAADAKTEAKKIRFAKNQDNVFNNLVPDPDLGPEYQAKAAQDPDTYPPVPADYPLRAYDNNNTYNNKTFGEVLKSMGYTPKNTRLTIVGTISDMCVLTSVVNALNLGYEVQVYVPGLNGGSPEPDAGWTACDQGQPGDPFSACCVPLPKEIKSNPINTRGWKDNLPLCQASSGYENALQYMKLAGAELLYKVPSCPWKSHSR